MRFDPLTYCFRKQNKIFNDKRENAIQSITQHPTCSNNGNSFFNIKFYTNLNTSSSQPSPTTNKLCYLIFLTFFNASKIYYWLDDIFLTKSSDNWICSIFIKKKIYFKLFSAGSNRQIARSGRPTNIIPPITSVNGHGDSIVGLTRREVENIPPTPVTPAPSSASTVAMTKQKQLQLQAQQLQLQQQQQLQLQQQAAQAAQVENGRGRRSNVVKEVERLKKNREERRQRQAELKEEKEALMNLDPGNPNWEFLAMIRWVSFQFSE